MTDTTFDPLAYIRSAPIVTIESGILLARLLVAALPRRMPAYVKRAAGKLERVAAAAQAALGQRQRELVQPLDETARDVDIAADQAWSALHDILDALARLSARFERALKARQLLATLFPQGTGFLRLSYGEQFVTMDTLLQRIDHEGLSKSLDAVVGPELLTEIRAVHRRYAAMVARRLQATGPADSLIEHVRTLQRTIIEYATAVVTTVDSEDAKTIAAAQKALLPIDNHRDLLTSGSRPADPGTTPPADPAPAPGPGA